MSGQAFRARVAVRVAAVLTRAFLAVALMLPAWAAGAQTVQEFDTPGGIRVWLVEERTIPFVALEIRFRGGTSLDRPGKRGAVYMMAGLLEEGAGELDAQGFARRAEELAASFSFDAHGDAVTVSARFLTENRDQAVQLLRKALIEPRFDQDAIDRVRAQVLSIIAANAKDPEEVASETFDRLIYGDHPYATASTGTPETVNALTRDDIVQAWRDTMARDRLYVAVVGDISAADLGPLLDGLLGDLPETGAPFPPRAKLQVTGGVTVVDMPTPQAVAVFGHEGIDRDDPDFYAAYVMNQIFGASGFTSRLAQEVREKRGLTYGVYTWLASYDLASVFMGTVASANDRIAEAIEVIRAEWARMAEQGATAAELEAAKKYLTGAYPLRFDGNARIARILVGMQLDGLPTSYISERNRLIEAVTLEDVNRVARRLLRPDRLRIVVVGRPKGLKSTD